MLGSPVQHQAGITAALAGVETYTREPRGLERGLARLAHSQACHICLVSSGA